MSQIVIINTMICADNEFIINASDAKLQLAIYKVRRLSTEYNMIILIQKMKVMAYKGDQSLCDIR